MGTVLIDTNVLIDRLRNEPRALEALKRVSGRTLVLCDIVVAEMLASTRNKKEYEATGRELNKQFHVLSLTLDISQHFRSILAHDAIKLGVHLADQLIDATAMAHEKMMRSSQLYATEVAPLVHAGLA